MSVFSRTIGLRGEDISTEILAYLLSPENSFVPFQKLFFLRTCNTAKSSADLNAELVTQPRLSDGIPDALILMENSLVLLENKLGSPLSGDDQLVRYVPILQDDVGLRATFPTVEPDRIEKRILVFLAPSGTINASINATENYSSKKMNKGFEQICSDSGVTFLPIAWEDVIADLDDSNALQRELRLYVQDYIGQEMTMPEKNVLSDASIPTALEKLFKRLRTLKDSLSVDGFRTGRMGQSYNYYGFDIKHEGSSLWFGYSLPTWAIHTTPVFLQIRENWIKLNKVPTLSTIKELGFRKDDKLEWLLPFPVAEIESWNIRLPDVLLRIAAVLNDPNSRQE